MKKLLLLLAIIMISLSATSQINSEQEMFALEFSAEDEAFSLVNPVGVESVNKQIDLWKRKRDYKNSRLEACDKTRSLLDAERPKLIDRRSMNEWKAISDNLKDTRRVIKHLGSSKQ